MNEKVRVNSVELQKCIDNVILLLFPDIAEVPGKRVILKLDRGPGRMNVEIFASSKVQGLCIVPGLFQIIWYIQIFKYINKVPYDPINPTIMNAEQ